MHYSSYLKSRLQYDSGAINKHSPSCPSSLIERSCRFSFKSKKRESFSKIVLSKYVSQVWFKTGLFILTFCQIFFNFPASFSMYSSICSLLVSFVSEMTYVSGVLTRSSCFGDPEESTSKSVWQFFYRAFSVCDRSCCISSTLYLSHTELCDIFVTGPSFAVDTACSASLLALDHALRAIRTGLCDAAVVGGTNLCMHPSTTAQFTKLGMLSPHGACKSFDAAGRQLVR